MDVSIKAAQKAKGSLIFTLGTQFLNVVNFNLFLFQSEHYNNVVPIIYITHSFIF